MANQIRTPVNEKLADEGGLVNRIWHRFFTQLADRCGIIEGSTASTATTGVAGALPAQPAGYLSITIDGTDYKVPYYNV